MYLAYIDDSDTRAKDQKWQVLCAVLIPDVSFFSLEAISSDVISRLMTEERFDEFTEFHACELYGGYGIFEGIEQGKRLAAIREILKSLPSLRAKISYGAIDLEHLKRQPYASANPLDIAFRMCAEGVESWFRQLLGEVLRGNQPEGEMSAIFIADEFDKGNKAILQKSFRSMRRRYRFDGNGIPRMAGIHDDMYFGDSRFSLGIQMADLCSYFIARHLAGDPEIDHYYKLIEPLIVNARHDP
ncbi:MAG: DUF3800 domain-containing protein [Acidobacteriaceae bacterium]